MGGVGNGAAKEDGRWDLNLGAAAIGGEDHMALGSSLLLRCLGSSRDFAWKKRGERTLAVGP